ncbi:hypothetical protein EVA_12918 [gut metagenome]|uniref:Uncharacterized protein n=1 Tax=gut metagenome TaxID=749906 RepID=J9GB17_9ZZZZ
MRQVYAWQALLKLKEKSIFWLQQAPRAVRGNSFTLKMR